MSLLHDILLGGARSRIMNYTSEHDGLVFFVLWKALKFFFEKREFDSCTLSSVSDLLANQEA